MRRSHGEHPRRTDGARRTLSSAFTTRPHANGPRISIRKDSSQVGKPIKQIHLAAHFPGVNNTTVWSDPTAGSHIDFTSFTHLAQTAERAKFDFFFLAEGLRLHEQNGLIYDLDVVGRPDTFTVLAALASVTERLGLTGTINSTFNEPYEVARQIRHPRPPFQRAVSLERGHLLGRLHRGELPARRLPAPRGSVFACRAVPAHHLGAVRLVAGG